MRLTGRGTAVLVGGAVTLAVGLWGGYPFLRALGAIGLGAVLAAVLVTVRGLAVTVRREVYPDRVERGRPAVATLRVRNPGIRRTGEFLALDPAGAVHRAVRVRALLPNVEAVYHYELPTDVRGRLRVGPLTLHRVDPLGLARNRLAIGDTATLWVHPRQLPARPPAGGHPRHHHEGVRTDATLRGSVELRDVREYVPGDEVRHLHWKATARTGRLMVRDLIDPVRPRCTLLLDNRADAFDADRFEEAVELAAALLGAAARAGQHTRLVTPSGVDLAVPAGVPAVRRLLDELCLLGRDGARDAALVPAAFAASGGALLVLVAGTGDLAALAGLRHRYATVTVFVLGDAAPPVEPVPGARVLVAPNAEAAVRRWNGVTS